MTSTLPELPAGDVANTVESSCTDTFVAGTPPKSTIVVPVKPVPEIVTAVPPAVGPELGLTPLTVGIGGGGALYVNVSAALVALVPPPVVAVTSTLPELPAGDVANTVESSCTDTFVAGTPPKSTIVVPVKPVPEIVTAVPPAVGPELGLTPLTVGIGGGGGALYVNVSAALVALVPPPVVAVTSTLPELPAGDVANTVESSCTDTFVAGTPPKSTIVVPVKPVPEIVTAVPPAVGPELGLTPLTVGTGGGGGAAVTPGS